jgi:putative NIF3 family GTP cyclohydrolase 1 type 2
MKIRDLFNVVLRTGLANDPRGRKTVEAELKRRRKDFDKLGADEKETFDQETLTNPYADTRFLCGDMDREVRGVLVGIDIEVGELMLADRLRERGRKIDLVIAHHPEGRAQAKLHEVMHIQSDLLNKYGVPINVAEGIMTDRIREVERRFMPMNHFRNIDAARLLDIPFMCMHTAADNCVTSYLQKYLDKRGPEYLDEVVAALRELPEYSAASRQGVGPKILIGGKNSRAGRIYVDMTGGTGGAKEMFGKLEYSGVGTIVGMHIGEDHKKEAEKHHINVVIAGHMGSDSVGMNILLDAICREREIEIIPCSGLIRSSRLKPVSK